MDGSEKLSRLTDAGYADVVVFSEPSFDDALIGVSDDNRAVYDYWAMVEWLMRTDGMSEEEAMEFIDYNTLRSIPYFEGAPIVMYSIEFI